MIEVILFYLSFLKYLIIGIIIVFPFFVLIHYCYNSWGLKRSDKSDLTKKDCKKTKTYFKEDM